MLSDAHARQAAAAPAQQCVAGRQLALPRCRATSELANAGPDPGADAHDWQSSVYQCPCTVLSLANISGLICSKTASTKSAPMATNRWPIPC
eukprot:COSAG01_NODE_50308_length_364_cov_0.966038_1_plen_91_part_10